MHTTDPIPGTKHGREDTDADELWDIFVGDLIARRALPEVTR